MHVWKKNAGENIWRPFNCKTWTWLAWGNGEMGYWGCWKLDTNNLGARVEWNPDELFLWIVANPVMMSFLWRINGVGRESCNITMAGKSFLTKYFYLLMVHCCSCSPMQFIFNKENKEGIFWFLLPHGYCRGNLSCMTCGWDLISRPNTVVLSLYWYKNLWTRSLTSINLVRELSRSSCHV